MYQIGINIKFGRKIGRQNGHKNTNIFHCETFQNSPKLVFWVCKYTLCQYWYVGNDFVPPPPLKVVTQWVNTIFANFCTITQAIYILVIFTAQRNARVQ
jgi:hypothetical protein